MNYSTPQSRAERRKLRGLGDVVAVVTKAVGIQPCGGCQRRQELLNKAVPFSNPGQATSVKIEPTTSHGH